MNLDKLVTSLLRAGVSEGLAEKVREEITAARADIPPRREQQDSDEIRKRYWKDRLGSYSGKPTVAALAREYGCSVWRIRTIVLRGATPYRYPYGEKPMDLRDDP